MKEPAGGATDFMPPEYFTGGKTDLRKQDLWGIGACLYTVMMQRGLYTLFSSDTNWTSAQAAAARRVYVVKQIRLLAQSKGIVPARQSSAANIWSPLMAHVERLMTTNIENRLTPQEYLDQHPFPK
jgi:hypothetical protein